MPKYFILASKRIELRGFIHADSPEDAETRARDNWFIHDTDKNTITSGTSSYKAPRPIISEMEDKIKFLHIYDETKPKKATITVPCPHCKEPAGKPCRRRYRTVMRVFHKARHELLANTGPWALVPDFDK